jgi:hypothetical protein
MLNTKNILVDSLQYKIIYFMAIAIFFQQVFVINIGGSFKIYNILSILLFIIFLFSKKIVYTKYSFYLFMALVISPIISSLTLYFNNDLQLYYSRFPEAINLIRFEPIVSVISALLFSILTWVVINAIIGNKKLYLNRINIIRLFIFTGIIIDLYAIYGVIFVNLLNFPDLIPSFLDFRNSKPGDQIRPSGFSSEPGTFIFMLSWIQMYLIFMRNIFQNRVKVLFLLINTIVIILTFSSMILGIIISITIYTLLFRNKIKLLLYTFIIVSIITSSIFFIKDTEYFNPLEYVLVTKVNNYLLNVNHTCDSGSFRNYTTRLGIETFKDYPLFGTGIGSSYFFIWQHEYDLNIDKFCLKINYDIPPQNTYSKFLSEQGLFGIIFVLLFFAGVLYKTYVYLRINKNDGYLKIGLIQLLFMMIIFNTVFPIGDLFLWFNMALYLNYLNFTIKGVNK